MRKCLIETKGSDIQLHDWPSKLILEKNKKNNVKSEHFKMSHEGHNKPECKINYYYCTLIVKMSFPLTVWQNAWWFMDTYYIKTEQLIAQNENKLNKWFHSFLQSLWKWIAGQDD